MHKKWEENKRSKYFSIKVVYRVLGKKHCVLFNIHQSIQIALDLFCIIIDMSKNSELETHLNKKPGALREHK